MSTKQAKRVRREYRKAQKTLFQQVHFAMLKNKPWIIPAFIWRRFFRIATR